MFYSGYDSSTCNECQIEINRLLDGFSCLLVGLLYFGEQIDGDYGGFSWKSLLTCLVSNDQLIMKNWML